MASMSCTMSKSNAYPETYFKAISTKNASNASSFNVDKNLLLDIFHLNKSSIEEAERIHREQVKNVQVTMTPLADEIAKARQRLIEFRGNVEHDIKTMRESTFDFKPDVPSAEERKTEAVAPIEQSFDVGSLKFFEKKMQEMQNALTLIQKQLSQFDARLSSVEKKAQQIQTPQAKPAAPPKKEQPKAQEDDDDVDLFASDSDDDEAKEKREKLLSAYNEKKSKKPALIAKSSILIDVKPWDDETDMKAMEAEVRKIEMDGLLWGASKLVPLAYGIHKLQINCVIEDDKVSTDALQEQIESIEDFVQSTDIAAFNKI